MEYERIAQRALRPFILVAMRSASSTCALRYVFSLDLKPLTLNLKRFTFNLVPLPLRLTSFNPFRYALCALRYALFTFNLGPFACYLT